MGRTKVSPAKRASAAAASEKAAANAAKRRAAAAEPFDDQVTGVVDQECPPGSPGAEFEAQLRELLEPDQLEPASRVLQEEEEQEDESIEGTMEEARLEQQQLIDQMHRRMGIDIDMVWPYPRAWQPRVPQH